MLQRRRALPLFSPDEMIRPLPTPKVQPLPAPQVQHQTQSIFFLGDGKAGEGSQPQTPNAEASAPSFPSEPRPLDECLAILKNPEVGTHGFMFNVRLQIRSLSQYESPV